MFDVNAPCAVWPSCAFNAPYVAVVAALGEALNKHVDWYSTCAVAHATASPLHENPALHEPPNDDCAAHCGSDGFV